MSEVAPRKKLELKHNKQPYSDVRNKSERRSSGRQNAQISAKLISPKNQKSENRKRIRAKPRGAASANLNSDMNEIGDDQLNQMDLRDINSSSKQ